MTLELIPARRRGGPVPTKARLLRRRARESVQFHGRPRVVRAKLVVHIEWIWARRPFGSIRPVPSGPGPVPTPNGPEPEWTDPTGPSEGLAGPIEWTSYVHSIVGPELA